MLLYYKKMLTSMNLGYKGFTKLRANHIKSIKTMMLQKNL